MKDPMNDRRVIVLFVIATSLVFVALLSSSAQRRVSNLGVYEGEDLARSGKAIANIGNVSSQAMAGFGSGWSGNAQLFWGGGQPGAVLNLTIDPPAPGTYGIELHLTRAPDFGQLQFKVDGKNSTVSFDGYAPMVEPSGPIYIGSFEVGAATHLTFLISGKNPKSSNYLVGLDRIRLFQTPTGSASQSSSSITSSSGPINPARLGIRTTLELWNGIGSPTKTGEWVPTYVAEAVFNPANPPTKWLWSFQWSTTVVGGKGAVLVGSTDEPSQTDSPLAPPGLVGKMTIPMSVPPSGVTQTFILDIESLVNRSVLPPAIARAAASHLYMRVVLLDDAGLPVGPPSSVAVLTRGTRRGLIDTGRVIGPALALQAAKDAMAPKAKIYDLKIIARKPVTFPDPNLWGCVEVLKNPYYNKNLKPSDYGYPLIFYGPGKHCPPPDPKYMAKEKTAWDWIEEGLKGWAKAYDGLAHFYDDAKDYVASKFAEAAPCEMLGKKLGSECQDAVKDVAGKAMSAGLVAAGVPPTIPDLAELKDIAKGKVVDGAVDYTCKAIESQGGFCTPEMRAKLAKTYNEGVDKITQPLQQQAKEPNCNDFEGAKEYGLVPLPCFTDHLGTDVKPWPGATYEPSMVTVRVTRLKPNPDFIMPNCSVSADMFLKNEYNASGVHGGTEKKMKPIEGPPFENPKSAVIPPFAALAVGKWVDVKIVFTHFREYSMGWSKLYDGGKGTLTVTSSTITGAPVPGYQGEYAILPCSESHTINVTIPKKYISYGRNEIFPFRNSDRGFLSQAK